MMARISKLLLAAAACAFVYGATPASAGDHLLCYKVREPRGTTYTADFVSNTGEATVPGCQIKTGAKYCCDAVDKTNIAPTPPGGPTTANTHKFCCYKVKCTTPPANSFQAKDQFGNRAVTFVKPKLLCAPSSPSGAFLDTID